MYEKIGEAEIYRKIPDPSPKQDYTDLIATIVIAIIAMTLGALGL